MTDYSKTASNLGRGIYQEFIGADGAIIPRLQDLIAGHPQDVVAPRIAEYWEIVPISVDKALRMLSYTSVGSVPYADNWKFPLRAAQCAALADRRLKAALVPRTELKDSPREVAIRTIHDIGRRAVDLMHSVLDPSLLRAGSDIASNWDEAAKERVALLGMKPHTFVRIIAGFVDMAAPGGLSDLLETAPTAAMHALYRIGTAAAVVGHELQIEFVPFNDEVAST